MIPEDPIGQIVEDRERARGAADPFADLCILATLDPGESGDPVESGGPGRSRGGDGPRRPPDAEARPGAPGVRTLVLRDVGPDGLGLLVSRTSPKWAPLEGGRYECLLVWLTVRRQYRIRGGLAPMPDSRVQRYWEQKVHESRLLDLYYSRVRPQSSPVASRDEFLAAIDVLRRQYPAPDAVPRPTELRGVYLVPERIEAWRGSPDRLHDRHRYRRTGTGWAVEILVP